ncbi:hypothetical protein Baya_2190 [Bagarius yarrelli]|uniref:Uncharacterized protein n=1 Tax=Bagarius yarrelli TaxID=175774 RepID=A0A556TNA7_BAGYA|nr:hypothetical protein Baya_2190 [Bagarius yarrelli]
MSCRNLSLQRSGVDIHPSITGYVDMTVRTSVHSIATPISTTERFRHLLATYCTAAGRSYHHGSDTDRHAATKSGTTTGTSTREKEQVQPPHVDELARRCKLLQ